MSKTLWGGHTGLGQGRRQAPLPSRSVKASRLAQVGLRSAFPDMLLLPLGKQSGFPMGPQIVRDSAARALCSGRLDVL